MSALAELRGQLGRAVNGMLVGHEDVLDVVVTALAVSGHVLLEGPPGTGKTLLASAVSRALGLSFRRLQLTPDMLPSDITGTMILREGKLEFREGPVFTNILLADEVNRTPPKTQAALLEAMQERQVTVEGIPRPLPDPFLVIATQNPIEFEGTYPLPEAQLDRFLVKVEVTYPAEADEMRMLELAHEGVMSIGLDEIPVVASATALRAVRADTDATTAAREVVAYVAAVVRASRTLPSVALGASPRAAVHLLAAARGAARLAGRDFVTPDDVVRMARPVLRHRLILRPEADLERFTPDDAVAAVLAGVPVPR